MTEGGKGKRIRGHDDVDTDDLAEIYSLQRAAMTGELDEDEAELLLDEVNSVEPFPEARGLLENFMEKYVLAEGCDNYGVVKVVKLEGRPEKRASEA